MTATGRLRHTLGARTHRIVYGEPVQEQTTRELDLSSTIDLAHVVMLYESGLLPGTVAAALLARIRQLRSDGFRELLHRDQPRGLYLMYESYLIEDLGVETGGKLHTGRSRNDIKATVTLIKLREHLLDLLAEMLRLQAALLSRARIHRGAVMPIYTHFQPAMPVTYGYYLEGIATALDRDIAATRYVVDEMRRCPLGAGAVAGTDLPIQPERTAALLGFAEPPLHATDAVAARDSVLRALSALASASLTISRLGTDLQLWSTQEFGFIEFPERLVGGSSAMPQKRNPFLLEHLKAKAAAAIGAWTASAAAMKSTPYTNSIEVGTEAVAVAWPALDAVRDGIQLAQVLVTGAAPNRERMQLRTRDSFVTATVIANRLVAQGVPFREAHHAVGAAVREAIESGRTQLDGIKLPDGSILDPGAEEESLSAMVESHDRGGGPGESARVTSVLRQALTDHYTWLDAVRTRLRDASGALESAVDAVITGHAKDSAA